MKLTKVELNEGIRLNEVKKDEPIYILVDNKRYIYLDPLHRVNIIKKNHYYIIRDNKIIDILQHDEYDNNKPYLIKKGDIIIGFIEFDRFYYRVFCTNEQDINHTELNKLIKHLNKQGFEVYNQEQI